MKLAKLVKTLTSASRASLASLSSPVTSALMPLLLSRTPEQGFAQSDHLVLGSLWVCHPLRARVLPLLSLSLTFSTLSSISFFRAKLLYQNPPRAVHRLWAWIWSGWVTRPFCKFTVHGSGAMNAIIATETNSEWKNMASKCWKAKREAFTFQ